MWLAVSLLRSGCWRVVEVELVDHGLVSSVLLTLLYFKEDKYVVLP